MRPARGDAAHIVRPSDGSTAHIVRPLDPRIRAIQALRRPEERLRTGLFVAEGVRFLARAVQHRAAVETVILSPPLAESRLAHELAERLHEQGAALYTVTPEVFRALSLAEEPQGIAAVIRQPWTPLDRADPAAGLCWLALEGVKNPGNLGTALRSSEAVGASGLILIGAETDPFHPACVRASMGSLFHQRIVRAGVKQMLEWKRRHGVQIVGTSPAASCDYREADFTRPTVILMGSERKGLTGAAQSLCDVTVRIPMRGETDSLNLGVATSILLYEAYRQRSTP
jgi:TrmH family RNA methyltransferase